MPQDITLTVDYHDRNCVIRRLEVAQGREQLLSEVPTSQADLARVLDRARRDAGPGGRVVWIQESTTGWARVQRLVGDRAEFLLANVLQMPLPPKARRRKTDKVDTARLQREYLTGNLPLAHQPPAEWRQLRRLVAYREDLVNRQTAIRNWINRYLAHETWADRTGLWSKAGQRRLRALLSELPRTDRLVLEGKLDELGRLEERLGSLLVEFSSAYGGCPEAKRLDAIAGIGVVSAVSIVARIGPIERFPGAESLIAFAGLAPGVQQSDRTRRDGHIGGGGTDRHLRHYLIEASVWARKLPRYKVTYERVTKRRGSKVGRLVVARMLLRSIYKVLRDGVEFDPTGEAANRSTVAKATPPVAAGKVKGKAKRQVGKEVASAR
jgi:transposase